MKKVYLETPEAVIKALKEGKTIKTDHWYDYELKDNFIIQKILGKIRSINTTIFLDEDYYILEEEPLKIEVGKFYKTRDGRKAWVVSRQQDEHFPYIIAVLGKVDAYAVTKDGRFYDDRPYEFDLVAPWEE